MSLKPIKIAILAMGGEGGGVLADWIVDLGEANGYFAQTTSVPGVAQRTGATIYYVELFPGAGQADARSPVLALMPMPGDVDVVLASELMEAGRAVQRGLVTPDRTNLLCSTHRVYSIGERTAMGDGRVDSSALVEHARKAAKRFVSFDMAEAAERAGSVISAVLFGSLCGIGVLPFSRAQFEATIERGGVGVKPSLKAFAVGHDQARQAERAAPGTAQDAPLFKPVDVAAIADQQVAQLVRKAQAYPPAVAPIAVEGVRRLIDYQDPDYAALYLQRLDALAAVAVVPGGRDDELLAESARYLALWMSYEDTIRVADIKTRSSRFARVRGDVRAKQEQLVDINEFMHPRLEEICETLPAALGRWLARPHWAHRLVRRYTQEGRVIKTSSLPGFLLLYGLSRWRRCRRLTLRYAQETERIERWWQRVASIAALNPALALEVAQCQRLVKGYSDTHARGLRNYDTLMQVVDRHAHTLAPAVLRELREAALADEHGHKLRASLQQHALQ
ncbi:indolepyruvate:ferredoxin oxidoreductase subunit B [Herbaspirillum rubrisubalbicans M1]|uniref:indolepyruvate oxidoreductase subunit beta family protein n=1 Tax=Herbaspirillum rubrisubalbicans TaxID=80842 RepID=UPI000739FF08|nr:indolepyruvate oxidoreductase subunit beta family protein [Herbaspirillum rubrisubalbicans]ALU91574.1 indolepyruvate:ferredoxin oxidoreductase subunit B [Herbaspirillum rubrisubalbicans M1]